CDQRFVDKKISGFRDLAVGGNEVTSLEHDDVSGDDVVRWKFEHIAIAKNPGAKRDGFRKSFCGATCTVFLKEVQSDTEKHNRADDDRACPIASAGRNETGNQKNKD